MSEANGTVKNPNRVFGSQGRRGRMVREILERLGRGGTYEDVVAQWPRDGKHGEPISEARFFQIRREMFPPAATSAPTATTAVIPDRPEPAAPVDYLGKLLRFGLAVEAVGGIANARRMLDALEQLPRMEGGR